MRGASDDRREVRENLGAALAVLQRMDGLRLDDDVRCEVAQAREALRAAREKMRERVARSLYERLKDPTIGSAIAPFDPRHGGIAPGACCEAHAMDAMDAVVEEDPVVVARQRDAAVAELRRLRASLADLFATTREP